MAKNTGAIKRGWSWDPVNGRLSSYVNGLEAIRLTPSSTGVDFMILGDTPASYYINFDASGPRLQIPSGVELDCESGSTFTGAGTNTISGPTSVTSTVTMSSAASLILPVKASGSSTSGDTWVDTTAGQLHVYYAGAEYYLSLIAV